MGEETASETRTMLTTDQKMDEALQKSNELHEVVTDQPNVENGKIEVTDTGFEDIYRTGNFGLTMGKFDQRIARTWCIAHGICIILIWILTITGTAIQVKYREKRNVLDDMAAAVSWLIACFGIISEFLAVYFVKNMHVLNRPYGILMCLRFSVTFNFTVLLIGLLLNGIYAAAAKVLSLNIIFAILLVIYCINIVTSVSFVGMCATCCDALSCCGKWCIYSDGEELAPGIPDPPSHENWYMCLAFAQGVSIGLAKAEARGVF